MFLRVEKKFCRFSGVIARLIGNPAHISRVFVNFSLSFTDVLLLLGGPFGESKFKVRLRVTEAVDFQSQGSSVSQALSPVDEDRNLREVTKMICKTSNRAETSAKFDSKFVKNSLCFWSFESCSDK